jgi:hypothetical protein
MDMMVMPLGKVHPRKIGKEKKMKSQKKNSQLEIKNL